MRRGWIVFLLAASARAQEFSETELDQAIQGIGLGQRAAVEKVAAWGPRAKRAIPALVAAWKSHVPELRAAASRALLAIGPDAIPDVLKALRGKDPCAAGEARPWLETYAREGSAAPLSADLEAKLLGFLNDADAPVRLAAARGLATRGKAIVPGMLTLLADKNQRRRQAAAFVLARVEPPPEEAAAALLAATSDKDPSVREQAVIAVCRLKSSPQETFAAVLRALDDTNDAVAAGAQSALAARGKEILPQLVQAWDGNDATARGATDALVRLGDSCLEQVIAEIGSGSPRRKQFGAVYLGRMGGLYDLSMIERALIPLLSNPSPDVRAAAAEAFGVARPEVAGRVIDALVQAVADPDPRVSASALAAAARGAPDDARVRAAVDKAATAPAAAVNLTAALLRSSSPSPENWTSALENAALPMAVRILAAERLRTLRAAAQSMLPCLVKVASNAKEPEDVRAAAVATLRLLLSRHLFDSRYAGSRDPLPREVRDAAERGLRWLGGAQQKDGRWAAEAWNDHDLGVTGLAVLALLAAGHTDRDPTGSDPYTANVRQALTFIVSTQRKDGLLISGPKKQHTLVEHAIATQALCEAVAMADDASRRPAAEAALAYCLDARNPYLAWRYDPRGGENDTNVTAWMATTLRVAEVAGFAVDPAALEGARLWIDKMTEPNFGQCGYNYPGGGCFRAKDLNENFPLEYSHATTAAGIWCRMILGEDPALSEMVKKGADLCLEKQPTFEPGHADFYYWYFGTLACFEVGGTHGRKWESELRRVLLARQKPDGSWDPEDAWGFAGGRVYSTAILTLSLLTPCRYVRGFGRQAAMPGPYADAVAAVKAATSSRSPRIRAAAVGERPK